MKNKLPARALAALFLGIGSAQAAAPSVGNVSAEGLVLGETAVLRASVTDADADLEGITFQVSGPGTGGWQTVGSINVSGSSSFAELPWTPPAAGIYTISVTAHDDANNNSVAAFSTFEVYTGRRLISNLTIGSGVSRMFTESGEILTKETSPAANVRAQSGGTLIFWSGGRVTLKSGFHAQPGSFFWGTVDHDNDGYSDVEETTDTDGDGIFDAWEVDHGLNPIAYDSALDSDGDGLSNLQEFQQGRDPLKKDNPSIGLNIFTPAL
jgi:hypothetical protein